MANDPKPDRGACGWLAEASAHIGDAEQAAHWWELSLQSQWDSGVWTGVASLLSDQRRLAPVWDTPIIQDVHARWQARADQPGSVDWMELLENDEELAAMAMAAESGGETEVDDLPTVGQGPGAPQI